MPTTKSLCIRNALILDGTARPGRPGDVEVAAGRIQAVTPPGAGSGERNLEASGLALAPGFIDIHSHSDGALAHPGASELLEPFLLQGVTTQVIGNCGLGVAPSPPERREALAAFMALVIPEGMAFEWTDFGDYLDTLDARPLPFNVAALAPHGALRCAVCGAEPGPARGDRLEAIGVALDEALSAGAFGLSAGLIYPPGMWSDTEELVQLCGRVRAVDGLFACHVRGSSELAVEAERELLEIGRRTGVRLQHSHHEAFGPDYWHLAIATMRMEDAARADGIDVASDVVPYHAVNTSLLAIFPPWALAGGVDALCERLADSETTALVRAEIDSFVPAWPPWDDGWAHNLVRAGGWDNVVLLHARSEAHAPWLGHSLAEIAARENSTPFDCAARVVAASGGDVMARYHAISGAPGDEETLRALMTHPHHAIGIDVILKGDGVAHPGGRGAMPRVLGHYGRDAAWLSLPRAVHKLTALPAGRLGLADRGVIAAGMRADLVLFDPASVSERGDYGHPDRPPRGIEHVFVNGEHAVADGEVQRRDAGRVLRRGRADQSRVATR